MRGLLVRGLLAGVLLLVLARVLLELAGWRHAGKRNSGHANRRKDGPETLFSHGTTYRVKSSGVFHVLFQHRERARMGSDTFLVAHGSKGGVGGGGGEDMGGRRGSHIEASTVLHWH